MTRVFWDTMLFIYLLEKNMDFVPRVREILARSYQRGDILLTSHFAVGEVMVGAPGDRAAAIKFRSAIVEMGFGFLPFDEPCAPAFANLRAQEGLKAPDSINLACAAGAGVDVFMTNDTQLLRRNLFVPGIKVIGDLKLPIL